MIGRSWSSGRVSNYYILFGEPRFELTRAILCNIDFFGSFGSETQAQTAIKPNSYVGNLVAINYELLVGTKKYSRIKISDYRIQRLVIGVSFPYGRDNLGLAVSGINARNIVYCKRYDFVLYCDKNTGLVLRLLCKLIYSRYIAADVSGCKSSELFKRSFELHLLYRFQKIINAVYLEGIEGILVVGCSKNYRSGDFDMVKQ